MQVFVAVPQGDGRAVAYRLAAAALHSLGPGGLASRWPRGGIFGVGESGDCAISLTHAQSLCAAVALADGPVGIDAEPLGRKASAVKRILAPGEGPALFAAAETLGLPAEVAAWCAKEAVGKALGTGLTNAERWALVPTEEAGVWATAALAVRVLRHRDSIVAVAHPRPKCNQTLEIVEL